RGDGAFTLVVRPTSGSSTDPAFVARVEGAAARGARAISGATAGPMLQAGHYVAYVQIATPLENADASDKTGAVRDAIGTVPGAQTYLSGYPAINHDTQPIYNRDLGKGESIAIPIAIVV